MGQQHRCALLLIGQHCSADDSSSMKYVDKGERIDDLNAIVEKVTEVATLFDDDGITVSPDLDIWGISEGNGFLCTVGHAVCSSLHMECNSCSLPCSLRSLTRQATVTISRCRVPVFSEVLGVSPVPTISGGLCSA